MATISNIQGTDLISSSRTVINQNFTNLNSDKIETSAIDTDTSLAANSDSKIPSQKAVKAYVDAGGNMNASETVRGIVEEATDAEVTAGTATGATGAKLFVTPAKLLTRTNSLLAAIPASRITSAVQSSNIIADTSETTVISTSLNANTLGTANGVRIKVFFSVFDPGTSSSAAPVLRLKYGATTVVTMSLSNTGSDGTKATEGYVECVLFGAGTTSSQRGVMHLYLATSQLTITTNSTRAPGLIAGATDTGTAAEDSTAAKTLSFTIQCGSASSVNIIPSVAYMEKITTFATA